jgi:ribosomal 50S subunit-associated protein YjgA (DUF615 family)
MLLSDGTEIESDSEANRRSKMSNLRKLTAAAETLRKAALECESAVDDLRYAGDAQNGLACQQDIRRAVNEAKRATSEIRAALGEEPTS